jgi:hypothetical protein
MKSLFRIYFHTRKLIHIYIYIYINIKRRGWKTFFQNSGPKNTRLQSKIFSRPGEQAPGIYVLLGYSNIRVYIYDFLFSLRPRQWPLSMNIPSQNIMYISCLPSTWPTYAKQTCVFETHNSSAYIPTVNTALRVKRYLSFLTLIAKHLHNPKIECIGCHANIKKDIPSDYSTMVKVQDSSFLVFGNITFCRLLTNYRRV